MIPENGNLEVTREELIVLKARSKILEFIQEREQHLMAIRNLDEQIRKGFKELADHSKSQKKPSNEKDLPLLGKIPR